MKNRRVHLSVLSELKIHDNRRLYPQIYAIKPGPVHIQQIPALQYVSQQMEISFHMDWISHPEPQDEPWIAWKVVNQLKEITKGALGYKFKLMPHEIVWHKTTGGGQWSVSYMMQVPECITMEMVEEVRARVEKRLRRERFPLIRFVAANAGLRAQKLHVGHYRDTSQTLAEIKRFVEDSGYRVKGEHREIYLLPSMGCYPPDSWKTVVSVDIEGAS